MVQWIRLLQLRDNQLKWRLIMTKRKKYFKEFKVDAIALVVEQIYFGMAVKAMKLEISDRINNQ